MTAKQKLFWLFLLLLGLAVFCARSEVNLTPPVVNAHPLRRDHPRTSMSAAENKAAQQRAIEKATADKLAARAESDRKYQAWAESPEGRAKLAAQIKQNNAEISKRERERLSWLNLHKQRGQR